MKIRIIFDNKYPTLGAASRRIQNYELGLKKVGADIEVISFPPPTNNILLVFLIPFYTVRRLINLNLKADIFFIYGFGWFSKLAFIIYSQFSGGKVFFELNEKPYTLHGSGRREIILKYTNSMSLFLLTNFVYRFADGFITISDPLSEFAAKYAGKKAFIKKIPILIDSDYYSSEKINLEILHRPYLLHTAMLNDHKDGIINVFEAFAIIHKTYKIPLHFYLTNRIGLPQDIKAIDRIVEENVLSQFVHYLKKPDDDMVLQYQRECLCTVLNKNNTEQNRFNFATKLGEYLILAKPVISTKIGEVQNYLSDGESCFFVNTNSPEEIAEKIAFTFNNPEEAARIGLNGKSVALKYFDQKTNAGTLYDFFTQVISG